ncbi:respiratory nitrate reductase subunit gamma [Nonomuraea deserti]
MTRAHTLYKVNTTAGRGLLALLPFSHPVRASCTPLGGLLRPYIVYRRHGR